MSSKITGHCGTQVLVINSETKTETGKFLVFCYRAAWKRFPENSIAAIEEAIRLGCDIVEIDIRKSSDGKFFLFHDETLERMTNKTGVAEELTFSELTSTRFGNYVHHAVQNI